MLSIVQHSWKPTTFLKMTMCSYCGELLWGFSEQGVQCTACSFTSHHKCVNKVASTCHVAAPHPIRGHAFAPFTLTKAYFCNFCRGVIVIINPGLKCDVCRYVVHTECAEKAPKNCRHGVSPLSSSFSPPLSSSLPLSPTPASTSSSSSFSSSTSASSFFPIQNVQTHHWVEGNTPQKSSCEECGLSCYQVTSLINFRCSWCKRVAHSSCLSKFNPICDGAALGDHIVFPIAARAPVPPSTTLELVDERLPPSPMFVFVNSKSGGQQGPRLLHKLNYLLNDQVQIFELIPNGPGPGLDIIQNYLNSRQNSNSNSNSNSDPHTPAKNSSVSSSSSLGILASPLPPSTPPTPTVHEGDTEMNTLIQGKKNKKKGKKTSKTRKGKENKEPGEAGMRIVVCGGDGTAGWVLQAMAERGLTLPLGIIPLGTGNDLARTLGWGPGYDGENVGKLLLEIGDASKKMLDRWNTTFTPFEGQPKSMTMTNYFSIGVDAKVALGFHQQREASPEQFKNRFINKLWYTKFGASAVFDGCDNLAQDVTLEVNNNNVPIPSKLQGLIIVNLPSYASGVNVWSGSVLAGTQRQAIDDGMLEVVGVLGSAHLGQIQTGLSECIKIAQGNEIKVTFVKKEGPYPVQVDGEPWSQEPGVISIARRDQVPVLVNHDKSLIG